MSSGQPLSGKRIVVVEDDPVTKINVEHIVRMAGGIIAKSHSDPIDAAILDVGLAHGATVIPIAIALRSRGVPFVFYTGCGAATQAVLRHEFEGCAFLQKPASGATLIKTVATLLEQQKPPWTTSASYKTPPRRQPRRF